MFLEPKKKALKKLRKVDIRECIPTLTYFSSLLLDAMICPRPIDLKRKRSLSGGEHSGLNIASELEKPESKKMKHDDDGDDNDAPKPGSSDAEPGHKLLFFYFHF